METRNVALTLEKAKEFYNSGNTALREVALQAFTVEEPETLNFTDIKTFWDAVKALGLDINYVQIDLEALECNIYNANHLGAIYKLGIIRKALNKGWEPKMTEGSIYYPWVKIYPIGKEAKAAAANGWRFGPTFITDNKRYTLVGGDYHYYMGDGLISLSCELGFILPCLGLLGCKSSEIAEHMSRYFAKEIFEATYAQHIGAYEWIDEI